MFQEREQRFNSFIFAPIYSFMDEFISILFPFLYYVMSSRVSDGHKLTVHYASEPSSIFYFKYV